MLFVDLTRTPAPSGASAGRGAQHTTATQLVGNGIINIRQPKSDFCSPQFRPFTDPHSRHLAAGVGQTGRTFSFVRVQPKWDTIKP